MNNITAGIKAIIAVIILGAIWVAIPLLALILTPLFAVILAFYLFKEYQIDTQQDSSQEQSEHVPKDSD